MSLLLLPQTLPAAPSSGASSSVSSASADRATTSSYDIRVRDASRNLVGQLDAFDKASFTLRFNNVGEWAVQLDATHPMAGYLATPGYGIQVTRTVVDVRGVQALARVELSGPVRRIERKGKDNLLIVSGKDDLAWLSARDAYPVVVLPYSGGSSPFGASAYDTRTGVCETILRQYVDVNAVSAVVDPDGLARAVAGLALLTDLGRGSSVTGNARFDPLMTKDGAGLLQQLARASSPQLGFKVTQVGTALQFIVYVPNDKTSNAKFSLELGNVADFDYVIEAPDLDAAGNAVVVGGGGVGTARAIKTGNDTTSISRWGRAETFVDARDTTDSATLINRRDEALAATKERVTFSAELAPVASMIYGLDYDLGDRVTAVVDGATITELIREVRIDLDGRGGETITPTIGSVDAQQILDANDAYRRQQAQTQTKNARLERRQ